MSHDNRMLHYLLETQAALFNDAAFDLQLPLKAIAGKAGIPYTTFLTYARGRTPLPTEAIKGLLRIEGMGAYLSRLFAPEGHSLVAVTDDEDHDGLAAQAIDFAAKTAQARSPKSPGGIAIVDSEHRELAAHPLRNRRAA